MPDRQRLDRNAYLDMRRPEWAACEILGHVRYERDSKDTPTVWVAADCPIFAQLAGLAP